MSVASIHGTPVPKHWTVFTVGETTVLFEPVKPVVLNPVRVK
jgi:hypothetical protein